VFLRSGDAGVTLGLMDRPKRRQAVSSRGVVSSKAEAVRGISGPGTSGWPSVPQGIRAGGRIAFDPTGTIAVPAKSPFPRKERPGPPFVGRGHNMRRKSISLNDL
jgi:hypothetical protein